MKTLLLVTVASIALMVPVAFSQAANQGAGQGVGRGRGGTGYAWNDKNKDGICDVTGKPVGQGRMCGRARGNRGGGRCRGGGGGGGRR